MKRTIAAILGLVAMSTAASATCEPTYITRWSYEYNSYMTYQGPERCYFVGSDGQVIFQQPIVAAPPPVYQQQGYYEDPYPVAPNAGAALVGGLIGAGIGYAIGNNNNNGKKNNYYYYNNGHKHGHKKKRYLYDGGWNNGQGRQQPKNRNNQGNND